MRYMAATQTAIPINGWTNDFGRRLKYIQTHPARLYLAALSPTSPIVFVVVSMESAVV
jgi:hypothetical protein